VIWIQDSAILVWHYQPFHKKKKPPFHKDAATNTKTILEQELEKIWRRMNGGQRIDKAND
jgi:hypothetical protein